MGMGWDLCAGLFYEHRFAMLIRLAAKVSFKAASNKQRALFLTKASV